MAAASDSTKANEKWLKLAQEGKGNLSEMKTLHEADSSLDIDCVDATGMTALMHAAFRGNFELCQYLLKQGADINSDKHDSQYTTLMFGALSGNEDVVNALLDAGAKADVINSVNRTAAEMAAFVAQYHIGGIIANFFPSKDLLRFTEATGQEKRPKLKKELLKPFHKFISTYNIHPIHLVKELKNHPDLLEESKYLCQILDKLVLEKMDSRNTHESLALKFHYLSCALKQASEVKAKDQKGTLDALLKRLATGRELDGCLEQVEKFVRSTLSSYPKAESMLFQMLLKKLSGVEIGADPTAIVALTDAINGNRMRTAEDAVCDVCASRDPKKCTGCSKAHYCSKLCQKIHRSTHKKYCVKLAASKAAESTS